MNAPAQKPVPSEPAIHRDPGVTQPAYRFVRALIRIFGRLYFGLRAEGLDRFPPSGPCLVLAGHASLLDPFLVGGPLERECHYLARTGVAYAPIIGWIFRTFNTHAIRREGIDREAIKTCAAILGAGWPLVIFPEGTRSKDGRIARPKGGFGLILDLAPRVPCVPVLIRGNERALGRGMIFPRPRRITVRYGAPFTFEPRREGERGREFYDRCADRLMDEWRKLDVETGEENRTLRDEQ